MTRPWTRANDDYLAGINWIASSAYPHPGDDWIIDPEALLLAITRFAEALALLVSELAPHSSACSTPCCLTGASGNSDLSGRRYSDQPVTKPKQCFCEKPPLLLRFRNTNGRWWIPMPHSKGILIPDSFWPASLATCVAMHDHTKPSFDGISFSRFEESVATANRHFSKIKEKYPQLKGYLVLSLPVGQTEVGNSLPRMIAEFPDLFLDSIVRTEARNLARELQSLEKKKESADAQQRPKLTQQIGILKDRLQSISSDLIVNENCQFEIRFHHLDYNLISKLQTDEWVDRKRTPQTKASIRIVLGTVSQNLPS